jgi:large subunit ribosomal protein L25
VAGERVRLEVEERERRGSAESRRLRARGMIPGVIYGVGSEPRAICVHERELRRVFTGAGGLNAILDVVFDGAKARPAVLKDYQQDPLRGKLTHVDLQEVRLDRPIQATVVIQLVGEAVGDKEGGALTQVSREVTVEALPMEIPESIDVDVTEMAIGDTLRLADVRAPEGVTFVDDLDETVIATITLPTRVVEPEELLEEGEEAEGPEAEQAPEGGSEAPAEPEADAAGGSGTTPG